MLQWGACDVLAPTYSGSTRSTYYFSLISLSFKIDWKECENELREQWSCGESGNQEFVAIGMRMASSRRGSGAGSRRVASTRRAQVDEMEEEDISWLLMSFILVFPDCRHQFLVGASKGAWPNQKFACLRKMWQTSYWECTSNRKNINLYHFLWIRLVDRGRSKDLPIMRSYSPGCHSGSSRNSVYCSSETQRLSFHSAYN